MTRRQIAKKLGLTLAQVRRAEKSGLRKLRTMLEEKGVTGEMIKSAYKDAPDEMGIMGAIAEKEEDEDEHD